MSMSVCKLSSPQAPLEQQVGESKEVAAAVHMCPLRFSIDYWLGDPLALVGPLDRRLSQIGNANLT